MDDVRAGSRRDWRARGRCDLASSHDAVPAYVPTVLVADHDEGARRALVSTLEAEGMAVVEAASLAECLTSVQLLRPDALVLARNLPDPEAADAVTAVRAADDGEGLAIVLVAEPDQVDGIRDGLQIGADDVVVRPFDPGEVLARVRARLRQRSAWLSRLERRRASHAVVVDTLARAEVGGGARHAAALVCRTVRRLPGVDFVAVLAVEPSGDVRPLAAMTWGTDGVASDDGEKQLTARQARALVAHADAGAWVCSPADVVPGARTAPDPLVCAAIRDRGALIALLALGGDDGRGAGRHTGRLTMATELAAVAAGCLAPALEADTQARARGHLADVIGDRAFHVVFQPIMELAGRGRVGIEASLRYDDGVPERTRLQDARGFGLDGDLQVAALEALGASHGRLPPDCWLSVDVSPAQLVANRDVVALLMSIDRPLVVELTEREPVDDYGPVRAALRTLGPRVELAVDHVGSGFASLRHVLALHPAFVKLDEAWVHDLDQDAARQALVAGLGYFATYTGCRLVGTGVRTEHEAEALAGLGVGLAQGPLFGSPRALRRRSAV